MSGKSKKAQTVPQWLRERKPPPYPGAFQDLVERIPVPTCCARHAHAQQQLRLAVRAPAHPCLLCRQPGVYRARFVPAAEVDRMPEATPCSATVDLDQYYDLCGPCSQRLDRWTRAEAIMALWQQQHQAPWN
jgi:hypothetical protein